VLLPCATRRSTSKEESNDRGSAGISGNSSLRWLANRYGLIRRSSSSLKNKKERKVMRCISTASLVDGSEVVTISKR